MIGWNSAEMPVNRLMKSDDLTKANFVKRTEELYGEYVDSILNMFPHENASEIERSAVDLGSIDFQDYNTWEMV
jgi:hypothetical protein